LSLFHAVLGFVLAQRLIELAIAGRNTRRLLAQGAVEVGQSHYPLIVILHAAWLTTLAMLVPADTAPDWPLLGLFALLQVARVWVIASLGPYWTTRVITLPGAPLVRRGPYRWLSHPNYLVVVLEIAVLPLAFGAIWIAVVFSALNAAVLQYRIRIETAALAGR
jgi:methyltransferase